MLALLLFACGDPEEEEPPIVDDTPDGVVVVLSPERLDFGSVELGTSALEEISITNKSASTLFLAELGADDDTIDVGAPGILTVESNRIATVEISWTPTAPESLSTNAWLRVGISPADLEDLTIPVTGTGDGPASEISHEEVDLGTVTVGCSESEILTVLNTGTTDLLIEDLTLDYAPEFTIVSDELPITVAPSEAAEIELVYTPSATQPTSTTLYIETNDPFAPMTTVAAQANGWIEADNTMYWEVSERQSLTILMNINEIAIYQTHASKLENSIETFFTYLDEFDVQFRMACFLNEDGIQRADVLYIDDTYTAEDSVDVFYDMLSGSSNYGDNDSNMYTLDNAVNENIDWLLEGEFEDSKLNLFAINDDADNSSGSATTYVTDWRDLKDDDDDVQVHAIGGTTTGACGSVPFYNFADAVTMTDGLFLDICAADWITYMEQVVEAFLGDIQQFELEGSPAASTIEIYWDSLPHTTGWTYDVDQNEIIFDSTDYPPNGTTLRVYYLMATECPE
ncbi:MAG TPA: choice-of-anchor D domain-containing protein [Myxococcota bacterium]|nr:choice-of-anchor D domain-containing protein [Myxococcota bacterium]